jgi:glyoxylase-like metal-dependent hydrolase (beta-lactamase superfamily II)
LGSGILPIARGDAQLRVVVTLVLLFSSSSFLLSPLLARRGQGDPRAGAASVEVLQLRPNFYMIAGAGGNIAVQVGEDGVVVVDSGSTATSGAVVAAIRGITPAPIRYVINTSADADHVGGNEAVAKAGQTLMLTRAIGLPSNFLGSGPASILAYERVLARMSAPTGETPPFPAAAWPTETFENDRKTIYLNGEGIEILHQPAAHGDSDSIVFFRRSDVIVAGDIFDTTRFPVINIDRGGSIHGELAALNRIAGMAIPSVPIISREAGTLVIPGHGHVGDQFDVVHYRDMVTIIRDHVLDLVKKGQDVDQVKAASPARGYVRRYGSDSGPWTTSNFVEAVYRGLAGTKP